MNVYFKAFLIAGILIPLTLHVLAPTAMPWWPDTVSLSIGFGLVAVLSVSRFRKDREMKRRLWNAIKALARRSDSR